MPGMEDVLMNNRALLSHISVHMLMLVMMHLHMHMLTHMQDFGNTPPHTLV